jgi:hypothetical protein
VVLSPPDAAVGHLPQEPDRRPGETVRSFLARRPRVAPAQSTMDTAAQALADGGADRYSPALDRWLPAWRRFGTTPAEHASHHDIRQELSLAAARATAQWAQPSLSSSRTASCPAGGDHGTPALRPVWGADVHTAGEPHRHAPPAQSGKSRRDLVHEGEVAGQGSGRGDRGAAPR